MPQHDAPTEWEQRRRLVEAIMDSVGQILVQTDHSPDAPKPPGHFSLRDIFEATEVTLDMIRTRVAHQAFAGGTPEAFWPPMRALLDDFAPELGSLACSSLEMDPAYERFWEPATRALMRGMGVEQATPHDATALGAAVEAGH
jgi:hypothetical protein